MVSTLVVTLGNMAEALIESTDRIIGRSDFVNSFCVDWNSNLEETKTQLAERIDQTNRGHGVLLLTDMFGGTSTNLCLSFLKPQKVEVVTGVNLPMIVKALTLPDHISVAEAAKILRNQGRKAIYIASEML